MKAFITFFGLLGLSIFLLAKFESHTLAFFLALITIVVTMRLLKHNLLKELAITGAFLGIISSYHFYLQPASMEKLTFLGFTIPSLPPFGTTILIFFGVFIFLRSLVALGSLIPIPIITPISKLITGE